MAPFAQRSDFAQQLQAKMPYTLEALPYAMDALEPFISKETLEFHYGKHHQGYVTKLNGLLTDHSKPLAGLLTDSSVSAAVYNNAAQVGCLLLY